jgi:hypothetical protein
MKLTPVKNPERLLKIHPNNLFFLFPLFGVMINMQSSILIKASNSILNTRYPLVLLLFLCSFFSFQCKKELTTASSSAKLSFSTNLLFFDTVFITQGSSVRVFVVHNNNNEAVVVSSIKTAGSSASMFNINVDGVAGTPNYTFTNVKIPANDSIYVFATVNVNPLNVNNPLVIEDSLQFTTNGNVQYVELQAFGWNAYYYIPNIFPKNGPAYYELQCGTGGNTSTTWNNDKPHVIFGYLLVPPGCTLTINAGAGVYLHDSAVIFVDSAASLQVKGTFAAPVTFQGDRLEPDYKYLPGQWNKIWLTPESVNNKISWAVIQNGTTGIEADTIGNLTNPTLAMDHTIIKGMSAYGLLGEGATIRANNCVIADCQYSCLFLWIGGNYHFFQCTFADYWGVDNSYGQRTSDLLYLNNYYQSYAGQNIPRDMDSAFFGNCIIYGALDEEVDLDSNYGAKFNYYFENCIIKTKHNTSLGYHYNDSVYTYTNHDPLFTNPSGDNYMVNQGSPALGQANPSIASNPDYNVDLTGMTRPSIGATIGAYEQ